MCNKKQNQKYSIEQLNKDLNLLHQQLKERKTPEEEIQKFFEPILSKTSNRRSKVFLFAFLFGLASVLYLMSYSEQVSWHYSALGRIVLIKVLPYWDWTPLKNQQCLIDNFLSKKEKVVTFNCNLCESLNRLEALKDPEEDQIQKLLELEQPVVVEEGLSTWPSYKDLINPLIEDETISNSNPCNLQSNLQNGDHFGGIGKVLLNTELINKFFVHFQNCDLEVMRRFRSYVYRPDFLPKIYSPVTYSWLIWNKDYNVTKYKTIDLIDRITLFGQIKGKTSLKLVPRKNCKEICEDLQFDLTKGQSLILTSLWDLEYKPFGSGENLAVILEIKS